MTDVQTPVTLAEQGHFWTGVQRHATPGGTLAAGQMSVQYQIPADRRQALPIVLIHGGGGQGAEFLSTPDGRPGWAQVFLRLGFAVYVVDRAGHGRSAYSDTLLGPGVPPMSYEQVAGQFFGASRQWFAPGAGGEAALDQYVAGMGPFIADLAATEAHARRGGAELLDRIGPAVLLTHSMGGPCGWAIVDERPGFVRAVVAVEPFGPPFAAPIPGIGVLGWGITAGPMTYDPPAADAAALQGQMRRIPAMARLPVAVVTGEASFAAGIDPLMVRALAEAGAAVEHLRLQDHGLHGNGHAMMAEKNSDAIAELIADWVTRRIGKPA